MDKVKKYIKEKFSTSRGDAKYLVIKDYVMQNQIDNMIEDYFSSTK